ncbi:DUF397 domain-containing protein [Actinoallomurus acanthiterrae]
MNVNPSDGTWRKSSYSGEEVSSDCVEVAHLVLSESRSVGRDA